MSWKVLEIVSSHLKVYLLWYTLHCSINPTIKIIFLIITDLKLKPFFPGHSLEHFWRNCACNHVHRWTWSINNWSVIRRLKLKDKWSKLLSSAAMTFLKFINNSPSFKFWISDFIKKRFLWFYFSVLVLIEKIYCTLKTGWFTAVILPPGLNQLS